MKAQKKRLAEPIKIKKKTKLKRKVFFVIVKNDEIRRNSRTVMIANKCYTWLIYVAKQMDFFSRASVQLQKTS